MHRCMRCDKRYKDEDRIILSGCVCGSKLFLFVKDNFTSFNGNGHANGHSNGWDTIKRELPQKVVPKLEKTMMHKKSKNKCDVVQIKSGIYEVNLDALFKKRPYIVKNEGVFHVDVQTVFDYIKPKAD